MKHEPAQPMDDDGDEIPKEHELDMHHDTLMKAEAIKSNPKIMKHLKPHMEGKMKHMKSVMSEAGGDAGGEKMGLIEKAKAAYKAK